MPNLNSWLNGDDQTTAAFDLSLVMGRDLVEVVFSRGASDLDAQCVRVVPSSTGSQDGETVGNNTASSARVVVIGDDDLDIKKGDLFTFRSDVYKVFYVMSAVKGHVQAVAEAMQ
jgi:hypothetical protein